MELIAQLQESLVELGSHLANISLGSHTTAAHLQIDFELHHGAF
jgi:hypothetical protein